MVLFLWYYFHCSITRSDINFFISMLHNCSICNLHCRICTQFYFVTLLTGCHFRARVFTSQVLRSPSQSPSAIAIHIKEPYESLRQYFKLPVGAATVGTNHWLPNENTFRSFPYHTLSTAVRMPRENRGIRTCVTQLMSSWWRHSTNPTVQGLL
jgi:hypothetical protein